MIDFIKLQQISVAKKSDSKVIRKADKEPQFTAPKTGSPSPQIPTIEKKITQAIAQRYYF
jgi:hypothetical protein